MTERTLVVTDTVTGRGKGVLLLPKLIATPTQPRGSFVARLTLPDEPPREVVAQLEVSHVRGPLAPFALVRLVEIADVPVGAVLAWDE